MRHWKCKICRRKFGVSDLKRGREENYVCPDCAGKIYRGELVTATIFGKKSKQRAKRKALKVGKLLSA